MTKDEIEKKVIALFKAATAREFVSRDTGFGNALDSALLQVALERQFPRIVVDEVSAHEWLTVGDAIDYIAAKLGVTA